jgi:hypothetical protein
MLGDHEDVFQGAASNVNDSAPRYYERACIHAHAHIRAIKQRERSSDRCTMASLN